MNALSLRQELQQKIVSLLDSSMSREEVSSWAMRLINDGEGVVSDPVAWEVLTALGGADLHGFERPYLYGEEDFAAWKAMLK